MFLSPSCGYSHTPTLCSTFSFSLFLNLGVPTKGAVFGEGRGPVHLSRAECNSEDMNLLNCTIDKSAVTGCDHSEDAGVICSGMYNVMIVYILL